ncbi:DNA methyltransferase [Dyella sp.]|uniref:DNA-methyltransferase n=1 Tax=Dyella sp. TaxID=1869338 RepID=UPI002FD9CBBC
MSVTIHVGDCRDVLRTLPEAWADSIVTDPPYELGFMGKEWDSSGVAFDPETWRAALRAAKPGAHLLAFGGTRTFHRMMCAIEDAGWEIRDTLMWMYGSGFPKSKNLDGDWEGWGTALKPAWEPIILARKPLIGTVAATVLQHGTGALNIDACRVPTDDKLGGGRLNGPTDMSSTCGGPEWDRPWMHDESRRAEHAARTARKVAQAQALGRWPANVIHDGSEEVLEAFPDAPGQQCKVHGDEPTTNGFSDSVMYGGFIGRRESAEPRIESDKSAARFFYCAKATRADRDDGCDDLPLQQGGMVSNTSGQHLTQRNDGAPGPVRNNHPTVKPTNLMRWLCRLVTPRGGVVHDPFLGSGSTGRGAVAEGFSIVGIELKPEHVAIAERRIAAIQPGLPLGATA